MRKKDYDLIANNIRWATKSGDSLQEFAVNLANMLEKSQPKFDRQKFLTACGIETNGTTLVFTD